MYEGCHGDDQTDSPLVQSPDSLLLRYSEEGVCHPTILGLPAQLVHCLTLNLQSSLGCVERKGACERERRESERQGGREGEEKRERWR